MLEAQLEQAGSRVGIEWQLSRMTVVILHDLDCGTSRKTLEMIRASGELPVIVGHLRDRFLMNKRPTGMILEIV